MQQWVMNIKTAAAEYKQTLSNLNWVGTDVTTFSAEYEMFLDNS